MKKLSRRKIIKLSLISGITSLFICNRGFAKGLTLIPTPSETEGPFYPVRDQKDKDADLTKINGQTHAAQGQHIFVNGKITDTDGQAVPQAMLDIWQADANGRYRHPRDSNPAKLDDYFQGWAMIESDNQGLFRFKTVMPGAYPASRSWIRPPHIHFRISKKGYRTLTTQMYFPHQPYNESDLLLRNKSAAERSAMTARKINLQGNFPVYEYNIVLDFFTNNNYDN